MSEVSDIRFNHNTSSGKQQKQQTKVKQKVFRYAKQKVLALSLLKKEVKSNIYGVVTRH